MLLHHLLYSFRIVIFLVPRRLLLFSDKALICELLSTVLIQRIVGVPISAILRTYVWRQLKMLHLLVLVIILCDLAVKTGVSIKDDKMPRVHVFNHVVVCHSCVSFFLAIAVYDESIDSPMRKSKRIDWIKIVY